MKHKSDESTINRRRLLLLSAAVGTGGLLGASALADTQAPHRNPKEGNSGTSNKAKSFVKLIALYRKPADVALFERHYKEVHTPLVLKTPHLKQFRVTHYTASPTGDEPEFYMMAEEIYESQDDLDKAKNSPELGASTRDIETLTGATQAIVIYMTGEESQWS